MDLETENRIAAILMKEAAELRREAAKDGIDAYLCPHIVRVRPNSRFLTATVLGVQQSNQAVEVTEMWRARQQEKEMDNRDKKYEKRDRVTNFRRFNDYERKNNSLSKNAENEDGLRDNEIEEFLYSMVKRGRGAVGSRMDETGSYLPESKGKDIMSPNDVGYRENWDNRTIIGPEKPLNLKSNSSSDDESREKRAKRKHRSSKEKSKDKKKKKREKKRSKHYSTDQELMLL